MVDRFGVAGPVDLRRCHQSSFVQRSTVAHIGMPAQGVLIGRTSQRLIVAGRGLFHYYFKMAGPGRRDTTIDDRIVSAARAAFGQYGYNATTTSSIARRAGVSEPVIYRHFGTKEALFDAAVLTPFTEFLTRHLAEWQQRRPGSRPAIDEAEELFNDLIRLFMDERDIALPLLAVYHFGDPSGTLKRRLEQSMRQVVTLVEQRSASEASTREYSGVDIPVLARIMVGVCFSLVTFPHLFDMDQLPRTRFVHEMARLTMHGIEFRNHPLREDLGHRAAPADLAPHIDHQTRLLPRAVSDELWARVESVLRSAATATRRGRLPIDDRLALEGVIDVLSNDIPWRDLPRTRYGISGVSCWRRLKKWQERGVWPAVADILRSEGIEVTS
ncbi:TetR family transcriptional regulator [Mycobacterium sp. CVI_P3]|uniref:TetR family transcriptional regulator n=1 Tax=Mycobacterium pinniadriaticum TaxID=2994102 RepID=A0ABT3SAT6_9MYCO|nr:transposase [Mycobacterium pinniadriaticum]MCX2930087.1 TetR family transcriptional regulator [Mycobacterium pinniadriaticum]MCX2936264.1 TetR family transcriptional regulator [Mycobacterium pinniadriaticum]